MKNQKVLFIIALIIVFIFAGHNLLNYFKAEEQREIEQAKIAEQQRIKQEALDKKRQTELESKRQAEQAKKEAQQQAKLAEQERIKKEREAKREKQKLEAEAREKARAEKRKQIEQARKKSQIIKARTPKHIEGIPPATIEKVRSVSARYITDNPQEFLGQVFDERSFPSRTNFQKLIRKDTNSLMLFSAITQDTKVLQALIDIGLDINSKNKMGLTPLMFAAGYNTPVIVDFLIEKGADKNFKSYFKDANALHMGALLNPNPDTIEALVKAGINIDSKITDAQTALLLAAEHNQNLEVAEKLAEIGADSEVYNKDGFTAHKIVKMRIEGDLNKQYIKISDEVNDRILKVLGQNRKEKI